MRWYVFGSILSNCEERSLLKKVISKTGVNSHGA